MQPQHQSYIDVAIKHTNCFDYIKYAAYRTAAKLRYLQKYCGLDYIDLQIVKRVFEKHRLAQYNYIAHNYDEVVLIVDEIYSKTEIPTGSLKTDTPAEMVVSLIASCYFKTDTLYVNEHEMKVFLVCLCAGKLIDKYKYLYRLFCDFNTEMSSERLKQLVKAMVAIPQLIGETSWSKNKISKSAIDLCFNQKLDQKLTEDKILTWLKLEHEAVVWLPTLHRLAHAETVKHDIKCNVCKVFPVVGFRYRCLKCFNYDQCQECFYLGRVTKQHKTTHPVHEYCQTMSSKDDAKALMKTLKNKIRPKPKSMPLPKPRFHQYGDEEDDISEDESEDAEDVESLIVPVTVTDTQFLYSSRTGSEFGETPRQQIRQPPPYHTNLERSLTASQDMEQKRAMALLEEENRFLVEELHKLKSQTNLDYYQVDHQDSDLRREALSEDDSYDDNSSSSVDYEDLTASNKVLAMKNRNFYLEQEISQMKSKATHPDNVSFIRREYDTTDYTYVVPPTEVHTHPPQSIQSYNTTIHGQNQHPGHNDDMLLAAQRIALAMKSFVNKAVGDGSDDHPSSHMHHTTL